MAQSYREIERKFTVRVPPETADPGVRIEQGYLVAAWDSPRAVEIRVRRMDGRRAVLTVKKALADAERVEVEINLSADEFAQLWALTAGHRIVKRRRRIALTGGLTAEYDEYEGSLAGIRVVEVEFPTGEQAKAFEPPEWFGPDVSGDPAYQNSVLASRAPGQRQDVSMEATSREFTA
ncbi:MAG TPA: CYTH domain-containing protein [Chthoniobacterales bacterium]